MHRLQIGERENSFAFAKACASLGGTALPIILANGSYWHVYTHISTELKSREKHLDAASG
jgi:hypothetical protein